ncbi:MAG: hypothetical protein ACRD2Y_12745 [Terriglobales bacterium]
MTQKVRQRIAALRRTTRRHARTVEKKLSRSGIKPNVALVESAAKYYPALKKLAEK